MYLYDIPTKDEEREGCDCILNVIMFLKEGMYCEISKIGHGACIVKYPK